MPLLITVRRAADIESCLVTAASVCPETAAVSR